MVLQGFVTLLLVAVRVARACPGVAVADWAYEGTHEPTTWSQHYPACGGVRQSPINIAVADAVITDGPRPVWKNYNLLPAKVVLKNNGHTLQVKAIRANPSDGLNPQLVVDTKVYELDQTHFHWGEKYEDGSEHTINNKRYSLEMHSVHRRVENGTTVSPVEAIVTTVLFELSLWKNAGLDLFLKYTSGVENAETEMEIPPFAMDALIPQFDSKYYFYEGSLTTPPCAEVVTFFIREERAKVTYKQLELFRVLLNEEWVALAGNFRPVQPLNGRQVKYVKA